MNDDVGRIKDVLRPGVPPTPEEGLQRDLWPDVVRRMTVRRVAWFDWIVAAAAVAASVGLPTVVPTLLYLL